jgi:2-polyprenyl-3-methyl-5-hydroxy-6-metoxy-1,4-benzoquinol methylase
LFLHPIPNPDQITDLYVNSDSESDAFSKSNLKLGNKIIKILGRDNGKILLDIGCQNGALLQNLQIIEGPTLYAVEPSKHNFQIVNKNPLIKITHGFFDPKIYKHVTFDLVNLGDVIEHLENPKKMIKDIHQILGSKGYAVITTPITNCMYVKLSNFIKKLLPGYPLGYLTPPSPSALFFNI